MLDAIAAHAFFESGQLREFWGDDPPSHMPRAVMLHERAIRMTFDADRPRPKGKGRSRGNGGDEP